MAQDSDHPSHFGGDRPIGRGQDKLGYQEAASYVAKAIFEFSSTEGFVLGLEGEWGSGKSSFVNLIIGSLDERENKPEIIKFSPWLIKSRAGLMDELFREIARAAEKIDLIEDPLPDKWIERQRARLKKREASRRRTADRLRNFSTHIKRVTALASLGDVFVPGVGEAGRAVGSAADSLIGSESIDSEKNSLVRELRKLKRQIVIFIDDLDRLEPAEAGEIVRLVRAVADFPNIVYVLCYSREILARSLKKAFQIKNGRAYIEKIVQVTFSVPKPEDFDLRRMFREELLAMFPGQDNQPLNVEVRQRRERLSSVIDLQGGRMLRTPRDVVRALNALRLYAGPIIDKIDLADMVWLQLTRLGDPELYQWVESYVYNIAAVSSGARVTPGSANLMARKLVEAVTREGEEVRERLFELQRILPGISIPLDEAGEVQLFRDANWRTALARFITDKRLASPEHFRFYFALSKPTAALEDLEFTGFLTLAEHDPAGASTAFERMAAEMRPQGGVIVESLLDRLDAAGLKNVPDASLFGIVFALANGMDTAALKSGEGPWGEFWVWDVADRLFKIAIDRMGHEERTATVERVFAEGKALGWLTGVMRDEIFAHGISGGRPKMEEERTFKREELDRVMLTLRARYRELDPSLLLKIPHLTNLLFGWLQTGPEGEAEVKAWVANRIERDDDMLEFLESMRTWSSINGEVYYPVRRENLEHFTSYPAIKNRETIWLTYQNVRDKSRSHCERGAFWGCC